MSNKQKQLLGWLVVVVAIVIAGYLGVSYPIPEPPTEGTLGTTHFSGLNVTGAVDFDSTLNVDGASTLVGDVTVTGDTTVSTDLTLTDWMIITPQTAISVTAGAIITPTGSYQPLTSAAAVTTSTSAAVQNGTAEGQLLILRNDNASDTITIDGTGGNVECKADVVLGAEDTITLIWNAVDWVCISVYDNS